MNKKHQLYPSLLRFHTLFGAERTLFLLWLMLCMLCFILNISLSGSIETIVMLFGGWLVIVYMTRQDPLFRQVYVRNIRYRSFYQAQPFEHSKIFSKYKR